MNLMHLWDKSLMDVLPGYYEMEASPQTMYRIKKDVVQAMRGHGVSISSIDEHRIKVAFNGEDVNMTIPPHLLAQTVH